MTKETLASSFYFGYFFKDRDCIDYLKSKGDEDSNKKKKTFQ